MNVLKTLNGSHTYQVGLRMNIDILESIDSLLQRIKKHKTNLYGDSCLNKLVVELYFLDMLCSALKNTTL